MRALRLSSSGGVLSPSPELGSGASNAARTLARHGADRARARARAKIRANLDKMRADLRATGRDFPPIDWENL